MIRNFIFLFAIFLTIVNIAFAKSQNIGGNNEKNLGQHEQKLNDLTYKDVGSNSSLGNFYNYYHNTHNEYNINYDVKELSNHTIIDKHILPENYHTNSNSSGFYFNFTGPNGTSMSTGTYVNNNNSSILPTSKSRIIKDYAGQQEQTFLQQDKFITNK